MDSEGSKKKCTSPVGLTFECAWSQFCCRTRCCENGPFYDYFSWIVLLIVLAIILVYMVYWSSKKTVYLYRKCTPWCRKGFEKSKLLLKRKDHVGIQPTEYVAETKVDTVTREPQLPILTYHVEKTETGPNDKEPLLLCGDGQIV